MDNIQLPSLSDYVQHAINSTPVLSDATVIDQFLAETLQDVALEDSPTTPASDKRNEGSFPIFALPRELRDRVYSFALDPGNAYCLECTEYEYLPFCGRVLLKDHRNRTVPRERYDLLVQVKMTAPTHSAVSLGLLRTSRQMFYESTEILTQFMFKFDGLMGAVGQHFWDLCAEKVRRLSMLKQICLAPNVAQSFPYLTRPTGGKFSPLSSFDSMICPPFILGYAIRLSEYLQCVTVEINAELFRVRRHWTAALWTTAYGSHVSGAAISGVSNLFLKIQDILNPLADVLLTGNINALCIAFDLGCADATERDYRVCCSTGSVDGTWEGTEQFLQSLNASILFDEQGYLELPQLDLRIRKMPVQSHSRKYSRVYEFTKDL